MSGKCHKNRIKVSFCLSISVSISGQSKFSPTNWKSAKCHQIWSRKNVISKFFNKTINLSCPHSAWHRQCQPLNLKGVTRWICKGLKKPDTIWTFSLPALLESAKIIVTDARVLKNSRAHVANVWQVGAFKFWQRKCSFYRKSFPQAAFVTSSTSDAPLDIQYRFRTLTTSSKENIDVYLCLKFIVPWANNLLPQLSFPEPLKTRRNRTKEKKN